MRGSNGRGSSSGACNSTGGGKAPVEVGEYVVDMFEADRQPDIAFRNAGRELVFHRELRMRGRCRMNGKAACVADIGDMVKKLQPGDEPSSGIAAAGELKSDQSAVFAVEIFIGARARRAALNRGMNDPRHVPVLAEIGDDAIGVLDMPFDAQRQGLDALQREESIERREHRAEIAEQRGPRFQNISDRPKRFCRLGPYCSVIAWVGRIQSALPLRKALPIEIATIDDNPADRRAMSAKIFRGRVNDDRSTVLEWPGDQRRGCVV